MLLLQKGQTKYWYLTLTEKVTITNPYFLFWLKNRTTNTSTYKILADVSTHKERYNQFQVIEGTTFTLDAGEYEYQVYAQTSNSNLNPALSNELVEEGLLKVTLTTSSITEYQPNLIEKIYE